MAIQGVRVMRPADRPAGGGGAAIPAARRRVGAGRDAAAGIEAGHRRRHPRSGRTAGLTAARPVAHRLRQPSQVARRTPPRGAIRPPRSKRCDAGDGRADRSRAIASGRRRDSGDRSPSSAPGGRIPAIDDKMGDMDVLGRQFARHALGQPAQAELAHREGRRVGITLDAGRGAGEQDRAASSFQHGPRCRLPDQEAAETGDPERPLDIGRRQLGNRPRGSGSWGCRPLGSGPPRSPAKSANSRSMSSAMPASAP